MRCPNCGAENPEDARYCGFCAVLLKDEAVPNLDSGQPARSALGPAPTGVGGSPSARATLTLTISLILLSLGFAAEVIYYERYVFSGRYYFGDFQNLMRATYYLSGFGNLTAILGLIFVLQALMALRGRPGVIAQIMLERFAPIKWTLILSAIAFGVGLASFAMVSDLGVGVGYRWTTRLTGYSYNLAWIIAAAALVLFSFALKEAEKPSR